MYDKEREKDNFDGLCQKDIDKVTKSLLISMQNLICMS